MAAHGTHQSHPSQKDLILNTLRLAVLMTLTILAYVFDVGHHIANILPIADKAVAGSYLNNIIAVTIAMVKAYYVVMIFMGVKFTGPLTRIWAWAGFVWFPLMLIIFGDYTTRNWEQNGGWTHGASDTAAYRSTVDKAEKRLHEENAHAHESHGSPAGGGGH